MPYSILGSWKVTLKVVKKVDPLSNAFLWLIFFLFQSKLSHFLRSWSTTQVDNFYQPCTKCCMYHALIERVNAIILSPNFSFGFLCRHTCIICASGFSIVYSMMIWSWAVFQENIKIGQIAKCTFLPFQTLFFSHNFISLLFKQSNFLETNGKWLQNAYIFYT